MNANFIEEVQQGKRFQFGKNWQSFLTVLNEERIAEIS
jgi:2-polyprenyl-6-hydroxyphenyl methylase/3-demethylubiquinone-9 3-methyltransferase